MGILQSNRTTPNTVASLIGMAAAFIPYTKNVTNVGAAGVRVAICGVSGGTAGGVYVISKFADDRPPIRFDDITRRGVSFATSGRPVKWDKVTKGRFSLSVVPCTQDDYLLGNLAYCYDEFSIDVYQVRQSSPAAKVSMFGIGAAECRKYGVSLGGCTLLSCPPCGFQGQPQGTAEQNGRWSGHTYEFVFTKWRMIDEKAEAPGFWSSLGERFGL